MKNALILHGTWGDSQENWFPWLKKELEKLGYKVWVPDLPQADNPDYKRYNKLIFSKWEFGEDSILIGHSSGAVAALRVLEALPDKTVVKQTLLVGGFPENLGWKEVEGMFDRPLDWQKIKTTSKSIVVFHSDDDPYVPLKYAKKLAGNLGAQLVILKGQKHFSVATAGAYYKKFPELLKYIQ